MIIDQLPALTLPVDDADELPIERGQLTFKATWGDLAGDAISELQSDLSDLSDEVATKQDLLVSGTNIKTINGGSILGSGDITVQGGGGDALFRANVPLSSGTVIQGMSNAAITTEHILARIEIANPSYIISDITWETTNGILYLSYTATAATTANILLVKATILN